MKKRLFGIFLTGVMATALVGCGNNSSGTSEMKTDTGNAASTVTEGNSNNTDHIDGKGIRIGFTNSYNGNSYRQTEERLMAEVADQLKAEGYISEYTVAEANQDAATQVSQIQDFVIQGYDVIIVDPASTSSLNQAIQDSCEAGIPVITVNDGPIDLECENLYQVYFDNVAMTKTLTEFICESMGGEGNLIELRGTAGTSTDDQFHQGVEEALEEYPNVTVIAEIYTDWTASKAQTELNSALPTLDKVDGLVTQGGDAYAAVQAFQSAGYTELPVIAGDNRGSFINWWANEAPEGYQTLSVASEPFNGAAALYIACDIVSGESVKSDIIFPFNSIDADSLPDYANTLGDDDVAYTAYSWEEVKEYE